MNATVTLLFLNATILLETSPDSAPTSSSGLTWFYGFFFTALLGLLFWFIRDKFATLTNTDNRIEKSVKKISRWAFSIDRRVTRIETRLKISTITSHSPTRLTGVGKEILAKSGVKEAADQFKEQLLEEIKTQNPETAYDVQEITRQVFQIFDFGADNFKKLKDYAFQSGNWGLSDILDVGAIYFRNIALKEFEFKIEDLNDKAEK